jgi:hypothetical protein
MVSRSANQGPSLVVASAGIIVPGNDAGAFTVFARSLTQYRPVPSHSRLKQMTDHFSAVGSDLLQRVGNRKFRTVLADPPWQFQNRTGKMAPEHKRLNRYATMTLDDILALPVAGIVESTAHLYLWVPNALLPEGLRVLAAWGFTYKSNLVWHKIRKDGGPDGRGVGFYFRNTTELILFGVRGKDARTLAPGRKKRGTRGSALLNLVPASAVRPAS